MRAHPIPRLAIGLAAVLPIMLAAGNAAADKCASAKLKAVAKREAGLLSCQAKVAGKGDPTLQTACDGKVMTKFDAAIMHAGTCMLPVQSDCVDIADNCRTDVRVALPDGTNTTNASKCEASRLKAAGKNARAKLNCYAKAAQKDVAVDSGCLSKADTKFTASFNKATGCTGDGQATAIASLISSECATQQVLLDTAGKVTAICPAACDFLDPSACLYPFPNDFFTVADPSTDTGKRVHFATAAMPRNSNSVPIDITGYNLNDGFSPGASILTHVPGVDLTVTGAAPVTDIARSLDPNAPVVLVNASTFAHQLMFVELDANASAANQSLIIRPSINLEDGTRYIVALRDMKDPNGVVLTPNADFLAYRDNAPTGDPAKELRRSHMEDIFSTLASAGVPRGNLYLAWDFTVASERSLTERLLFIRDDAFARLDPNAPAFTVTNVFEHGCLTGSSTYDACNTDADCGGSPGSCDPNDGVNSNIFRRVVGTYNVERYVDSTTPPAKFVLDPNGLPTHQATPQPASFVCSIPRAALPDDTGPVTPARASIYGHGLLGSNTEVTAGNVEAMGNEHNFVFCATKWIGMSEDDIPNAIGILQNLSNFPTLTDRLQQAMVDQLFLARLMIHPNGFNSDPAFQDNGGNPVIDPNAVFYDGNSQGGIFGGTVMAVAQDITRGVLGVPGMNYSLLLTRSTDFALYSAILYPAYPTELTRPLLLALIQMLWDRSDPSGYAHHITSNPLPNTPAHAVLLHEAFGDHQVANVATEVEARTLGLHIHTPAIAGGRSYEVTPYYGIPAIPSYPFAGSAIVVWDSGANTPPTTNTAPVTDPNVPGGFDPHSDPRNDMDARTQKSEFLKRTGGAVVDVCSGAPCTATH
jgi:hypothetical protein